MLDDSAVRFNLRFTGSPHADAAFLTLKVGPHAGQARQQVFILGQFDLGASVGSLGARGKNVEDQVGPIHHFDLEQSLDVFELRGSEFVVKNGQVHAVFLNVFFDLLHFTTPQEGTGIGAVEFLGKNL